MSDTFDGFDPGHVLAAFGMTPTPTDPPAPREENEHEEPMGNHHVERSGALVTGLTTAQSPPSSDTINAEVDTMTWQPIESAPRDSRRILVAWQSTEGEWRVGEAWWSMPYEDAPADRCWWQTMNGTLLSSDVHTGRTAKKLGATHWMPMPDPPD